MKLKLHSILLLTYVGTALAVTPGTNVIEFSEVSITNQGPFPLLTGSTAFTPFGLTFQGSAHLVTDAIFTSAGTNNVGIATTQCPTGTPCFEASPSPSVTFVFSDGTRDFLGASSATFSWVSLGAAGGMTNPLTATWYDTQGNVLFTDTAPAQPTPAAGFVSGQFSHTAPAGTVIGRVTFTGPTTGSFGVGRVEFTPSLRSGITASLPDLVATQIICPTTAGGNVQVRICNEGTLAAGASSTRISSSTYVGLPAGPISSTSVATPALDPGTCATISAVPAGCSAGRCDITAGVNSGSPALQETNTANNSLSLSCVSPSRQAATSGVTGQ